MGLKDKKPHKVVANPLKYKYVIAGRPKTGKTSLVYHITKLKYGGDLSKLLLLAFETGYNALDGIYAEDINDWEQFQEIVDELVADKDEMTYEILAIDTADIMSKYATEYVLRRKGIKDKKKYTALSELGYGSGYDALENEISKQIDKLDKAGYHLIFITHDKDKKFETREGVSYDKTILSLSGRVRDTIINMADFVVFVEIGKVVQKGKTVDKRYIYFRGESGLEAGSRFTHVPNRIEYDPQVFLDTVEEAILQEYDGDQKAVEKAQKEQDKVAAEKSKEFIEKVKQETAESEEEEEKTEDLKEFIMEKVQNLAKSKKMKVVKFTSDNFETDDFRELESEEDLKEVLTYIEEELE